VYALILNFGASGGHTLKMTYLTPSSLIEAHN